MSEFIMTLRCGNRSGIVAAVAGRLAAQGGDITEAHQFDDPETGMFFMRVAFRAETDAATLRAGLDEEVRRFGLDLTLRVAGARRKVLLLVSRFDHCLGDLLYRTRIGELPMEPVAIIGNHPREALNLTLMGAIPYHHLPVTAASKREQEAAIQRVIEESGAELVVLARYMQILSDEFSAWLSGRCINIHHSFLPGFKGAKPYHQAHRRGVKMIGATAHYVTGDLDEGPIICQDVEPVSHADTPDDLVRKGRDIERRVLARAVAWHLEDRVLLNKDKTVVFAR
ncbi:formyltetrahydrofolate deformylase [Rhizobium sp. RU35A]|uniref:Formyltetrahydrofolate deformylase n=1 Tax=Rhizobium straminoryzae TaxID=1387186 RepID=A0A549T0D5_9HYPH|nr:MULTISPECIES: formyltetrahydrofolate deformylase [Rhizobium]TRL35343.1 formyltetrahydrofolate deformylase [Rhizobium straminoryzae]SIQ10503.1 formyltetrahydrofolate deformylase [Rhizobium sp. RU35A]